MKYINGRSLKEGKYQAFAGYLSRCVSGYKEHYQIDIYAVSPANEPEKDFAYSSCQQTKLQLRDFV